MDLDNNEVLDRRRKQNRLAQRRFRQRNGRQKAAPELQYISPNYTDNDGSYGQDLVASTPSDWLSSTAAGPSSSPVSNDLSIAVADDLIAAFSVSAVTESPEESKAGSFSKFGSLGNGMLDNIIDLDMDTGDRWWAGTNTNTNTSTSTSSTTIASSVDKDAPLTSLDPITSSTPYRTENSGGDCEVEKGKDTEKDKSATDKNWQSPLNFAAQGGHKRIVVMLLQRNGVDCEEKDSEGLTPLMHATKAGHEEVVATLLSHGARVSTVDSQRRSALHWAVLLRREALLQILLKHCADDLPSVVNGYDDNCNTPLHIAIKTGFEAGVHILLEHGADVNRKSLVAARQGVGVKASKASEYVI